MLKKVLVVAAASMGAIAMTMTSADAAVFNTTTNTKQLIECNDKVLVHGSTGKCVQRAQAAFRQLGYGNLVTDGRFGNKTWQANYKFETEKGLKHDGKIDARTWGLLVSDLARIERLNRI